jgi:SAM-dependent methyltransferase
MAATMQRGELTGGESNSLRYSSPEVVEQYAEAEGLEPTEEVLFARYLKKGLSIIDLGVGGGRTTRYLAPWARYYVGIDYSRPMIEACRLKYPGLRFEICDASDLGEFPDESFDAAVFAFNGIDYLGTHGERAECMCEVARILVDDGVFIFSSHNAKALAVMPQMRSARGLRILWRIVRAAAKSIELASRNLRSGVFKAGEGYIWDPHHGGLWTYVSTPATLAPQLQAAGLELIEVLGGIRPDSTGKYSTPWNYYVCRRSTRP